ncbi:threonine 3-dehydrogenase [Salmonella enterica subsp. arizonae]|uniref:Threonine 3-dehydrogenase n=1 Tax=Salmonella enterica subsp. arizonae TaxID=59203 RepID=A0A379SMS0_SALER|nr:threonine 3-dehydrogenase [Salmonella enterica subsp. arizonae]
MKALSKLKAEEGIWMTDVPEPEVGHNDLLIKSVKQLSAALTFTSITGMSGRKKPSRFRWSWGMNMSAKWSASVRK